MVNGTNYAPLHYTKGIKKVRAICVYNPGNLSYSALVDIMHTTY
jgi:hypothetical protein